eukprot:5443652-Prymnesium_polylepis.1
MHPEAPSMMNHELAIELLEAHEGADLPQHLVHTLTEHLKSEHEDVREAVVEALKQLSTLRLIEVLSTQAEQGSLGQLLSSANEGVRESAINLLGALVGTDLDLPQPLVMALTEHLTSEHEDVREAVVEVEAFRQLSTAQLIAVMSAQAEQGSLGQLMSSANEGVRESAINMLGALVDALEGTDLDLPQPLVMALTERLESENEDVREAVVEVLKQLSTLRLIAVLSTQLLSSANEGVRESAIDLLGALEGTDLDLPQPLVSALTEHLTSEHEDVREAVADLFCRLSTGQLIEVLSTQAEQGSLGQLLSSANEGVRGSAINLLGALEGTDLDLPQPLVMALTERLESEHEDVREAVVEALKHRAEDDYWPQPRVDMLMQQLQSNHEDVRDRAAELLVTQPQPSLRAAIVQHVDMLAQALQSDDET